MVFVAGCYGDEGLGVKVNIKDGKVDISLQGMELAIRMGGQSTMHTYVHT